MATRFVAPLPALAGVSTRNLRTQQWWDALAPRLAGDGLALHADRATFTVRNPGAEAHTTLTTQQLKDDVDVELASGHLTVATIVDDVANGRPHKGLAKLVDRVRSHRALAGASVPTSAISRLELDVEYPTVDGQRGEVWSCRFRVAFLAGASTCEIVVDLRHPVAGDDAVLLDLAGRLVAERVGHSVPLDVNDHPATAPQNWRRTLRVDLPDAVPVAV